MYWYVKYPLLIILLILLLLGTFFISRKYFPQKQVQPTLTPTPTTSTTSSTAETPALPGIPDIPAIPDVKDAPSPQIAIDLESIKKKAAERPLLLRKEGLALLEKEIPFSAGWIAAAHMVSESNRIIMNSNAPAPEKESVVIQEGDSLDRIARHNNTSVGALQRLNNLKSTQSTIFPGKKLKFIKGKWSITVNKKNFLLALYRDKQLYRIYPVSTGRQDRTPVGTFVIANKSIRPSWTKEDGTVIPYGAPENILGSRWMGLYPADNTVTDVTGLGIHGTTDPNTIGSAASLGCVRMLNEDVEELYDFIPEPKTPALYTPVTILQD